MIALALNRCRPGAKWTLRGNTYAGIEWHDTAQSKPTEQEVNAAVLDLQNNPLVPDSVTRRQLRLELLSRNLLQMVEPAIQAALEGVAEDAALIEWRDAGTFDRSHPLVAAIGIALSLSSAEMDDIWRSAAQRDPEQP